MRGELDSKGTNPAMDRRTELTVPEGSGHRTKEARGPRKREGPAAELCFLCSLLLLPTSIITSGGELHCIYLNGGYESPPGVLLRANNAQKLSHRVAVAVLRGKRKREW